jgi:hypothetical protein
MYNWKGPQHRYAKAEEEIQEVYSLQAFTQTNILIVSSCIVLGHDMNYKNLPLCPVS